MILTTIFVVFFLLTYVAWRRYLWAAETTPQNQADTCPYSLTEVFDDNHLINVPHQKGVQWLGELFSRSARKFPDLIALQIPHTEESLTFAELDARAEEVASALSPFLTGPDQVVAVAMTQDNWQVVAAHLGILKAGGTMLFLDTALPDSMITHMLNDAQPVVILTRGQARFRDLSTLDVLALPDNPPPIEQPPWLDDPTQRLASIFYTSGTTGMPKGVECHHAGYVNLALSYADYFDLIPGMDATSLTSSLGYDGSISEMYSAWVSGCAVVMLTGEQVRSGPDLQPGAGPGLPAVPLYRACGRGLPQRAGGALDAWPTTDHQHLRPHGSKHRHQPPKPAAGGTHHHRLTACQRHLCHSRN
jgi:non-ribosomal peptide synthetase component F